MIEFDDIVTHYGVYRTSEKAQAEIKRLVREHGLGFVFNPGGGEFNGANGFRCQISTCDDVEDLNTLRKALVNIRPSEGQERN
jgi:hypothetical protein